MHNYGGYIALQQLSQTNLNNGMQKTSVEIHSFFCYVYGFQCNIVNFLSVNAAKSLISVPIIIVSHLVIFIDDGKYPRFSLAISMASSLEICLLFNLDNNQSEISFSLRGYFELQKFPSRTTNLKGA